MRIVLLLADSSQEHVDAMTVMWAGALSAAISLVVTLFMNERAIRTQKRGAIQDAIHQMLDWAIQYPYLEHDAYCASWANLVQDEAWMRYDNYCCHVFNTLYDSWAFSGGDEQKMRDILYPDELIERHRIWWDRDGTNQRGYAVGFRQFVRQKIRELEGGKNR